MALLETAAAMSLEMLKITIKHNLDDLAHLRWMRKRKEAEEEAKDYVECSVFAPARAGTRSLDPWSRHFSHQARQLAAAVRMATEVDASANRKGFAKLSTIIKRGTLVQFFLEVPTLAVETAFQEVKWLGEPVSRRIFGACAIHGAPWTVSGNTSRDDQGHSRRRGLCLK